ncbi:MAG: AmmeMemoRadiSam system protein B [candidate division Zixibacteria bacterium]|nr:AmmeMemoRadiSam system protein B [candidate division Zixibacteria bacterium]
MEKETIRKPIVAGSFYPGDPVTLTKLIASFFAEAPKAEPPGDIVGLVSPHAGYIYSGHVAAIGYKLLEGIDFETVVVISPSHSEYFDGVSVYPGEGYQTPLGIMKTDIEIIDDISNGSNIVTRAYSGHSISEAGGEHALEVQIPFIQVVMPKAKLVPLVMGRQNYAASQSLADDLYRVLKGKSALVIASTDLSHFHSSEQANIFDNNFITAFEDYDPKRISDSLETSSCEACGGGPVIASMLYAEKLGNPKATALKYADSSVTSGDKSSVVGYLSGVITI